MWWAFKNMVTGSSIFQHKVICKATWGSHDHATKNRSTMCAQNPYRIQEWSELQMHCWTTICWWPHLSSAWSYAQYSRTPEHAATWIIWKTADKFRLNLTNRFPALQELCEDSNTDLESKWEHAKLMYTCTCEEVVGRKTLQHKEWISRTTIQKIRIRRDRKAALNNSWTWAAKAAAQKEYNEVHKGEKKQKSR